MAKRINPDTASQQELIRLQLANMRAAAEAANKYAQTAAADVKGFGQSAARGGMFMDVSAAPGFQNPFTGQMTKYLQETITAPVKGALNVYKGTARQMNMPYWQRLLKGYKAPQAGSGMYGDTTTAPVPSVVPQRVL